MLGFNLKIRKAKKPATAFYLDCSLKMASLPPGNHRISPRLSAVSFCFIILSSSGIKGIHHFHAGTSVTTGIKGMCYHCLFCKAGQCGCFTSLIFG